MVQDFDGGTYDKGETLRVSNTFISGTLKCLADQVEHPFFIRPDIGICRTSGFITLDVSLSNVVRNNDNGESQRLHFGSHPQVADVRDGAALSSRAEGAHHRVSAQGAGEETPV